MKSLFSIGSGLVTLLLATNPTNAEIPVWEFGEEPVGSKTCIGCKQCYVESNFAEMPFGVTIGNASCVDLNGRMGAGTEYGTLIVDFSPTVPGATGMYMDLFDGTWIGGIAWSKANGVETNITLKGTGQWGSASYIGGWCVANIVQHQKVNAAADATVPEGQYSYDIDLFDNGTPRNWIGGTKGGPLYVQDGKTQGLDSLLPQVFEITSGSKSFLTLFTA